MKINVVSRFLYGIVITGVITMLFSCGNATQEIEQVPVRDTLPVEQARNITMYYSDSGIIKAKMTAPLMLRYEDDKQKGVLKLPDGLKVIFYDSAGVQETVMTARYGERFDEKMIIEVKHDVLVLTTDSKRLTSNHLVWDERNHRVYSNEFVKITTPDKVIYGDGFESDENFDQYRIIKPKGEFLLKKDKNATE